MRVVYVTQTAFLDTALNRIRALSKLVDLHLVLELTPQSWTESFFDIGPRLLHDGVVSAVSLLTEALPPGVAHYWQGLSSANLAVFKDSRSISPRVMRTSQVVAKAIERLRPDVLHLDEATTRLGWGLWRLRRVPTVMTIHDPLPHSGAGSWRVELPKKLSYWQVDRFILQNRGGLEQFSRRYRVSKQRIDVALMGPCDVLRDWVPDACAARDRGSVLFFGRMASYKGLDVFEKAVSIAAKVVPNLRVIAAGAPMTGFFPPTSHPLENGGAFEVRARHIPTREAAHLFANADLVVLPYRDATQSGVVLSAFAFGVPVVASNVGGVPEYVGDGDNGLLVEPGNARELATAIVRVMGDEGLKRLLKDGVHRRQAADLGWERVAADHIESYRRAIRGKR